MYSGIMDSTVTLMCIKTQNVRYRYNGEDVNDQMIWRKVYQRDKSYILTFLNILEFSSSYAVSYAHDIETSLNQR